MKLTKRISAALEFKPADCWVGVFWRRHIEVSRVAILRGELHVWICLVPMVPLHLVIRSPVLAPMPQLKPNHFNRTDLDKWEGQYKGFKRNA
jgi:hypothetical protein